MKTILLYSIFAIVSIIVNLVVQEISIQIYSGPYSITLSMFWGTATGLVTKYLFDKYFIFKHKSANLGATLGNFAVYTGTGIFTTSIFWGFEFGFEYLFGSKFARYCGAVIGLSIGYCLKYQLDKRIVFTKDLSVDENTRLGALPVHGREDS